MVEDGMDSTGRGQAVMSGLCMRIEFVLHQCHGQIGSLRLDERSDGMQN